MEEKQAKETKRHELFFSSQAMKRVILVLGIALILLLVFKAGEFVGFHKAGFSYRLGERYYRGFELERGGGPLPFGFSDDDFVSGHGTQGVISSVASSSFVVQ